MKINPKVLIFLLLLWFLQLRSFISDVPSVGYFPLFFFFFKLRYSFNPSCFLIWFIFTEKPDDLLPFTLWVSGIRTQNAREWVFLFACLCFPFADNQYRLSYFQGCSNILREPSCSALFSFRNVLLRYDCTLLLLLRHQHQSHVWKNSK